MIVESLIDDKNVLTKGKKYPVLEIDISLGGGGDKKTYYRILPDFGRTVLPIEVNNFKIVDPTISSNFTFKITRNELTNREHITIAPARWLDESLWKYSFWESCWDDYGSEEEVKARKVFKEEYDKILAECGQGLNV
jgi:hypothetical protein